VPALALGGLLAPALVGREQLVYRDMLHDYWPMKALFWGSPGGLLRAWNPTWFGGFTLLGDIVQQPFYLPNLLFRALRVPPWPGIAWYLLAHAMVALVGTALLCRRLVGPLAAAVGATVFVLSGFQLANASNLQWACAASWAPLVLWAADRLAARPAKAEAAALALLAPQPLLAGDPQAFLVLCAACVVLVAVRATDRRAGLVWLALAFGGASLLAVPQVVATLAVLPDLVRKQSISAEIRETWSFHPARVPELWVPRLYGPLHQDGFWGSFTVQGVWSRSYIHSVYVGALWPALAAAALWKRRRAASLALAGLSAVLLLAMGKYAFHLYALLGRVVPSWELYRYPERLLTLPTLAAAVLAALGADAFVALPPRRRTIFTLLAGAAGLSALAIAALLAPGFSFSHDATRLALLRSAAQIGVVCAAGLLVSALRPSLALPLLCAVAAADLLAANAELLGAVRREPFRHAPGACGALEAAAGNTSRGLFRVFVDQAGFDAAAPIPAAVQGELPRWAWPRWREFQLGKRNVLDLCGYLASAAYTSLDPRSSVELWRAAGPLRGLQAIGTRFAVAMPGSGLTSVPGVNVRASDPATGALVLELPGAVPRVFRPAAVEADAHPRARISNDRRTLTADLALLESVAQPHQPSPGARLITFDDAGDSISFAIDQQAPGYWILADALDSDWRAEVDGAPVPIVRADLVRRAIWFPAGRHTVALRCRPLLVPTLFWASVALAAAFAFAAFPRQPRPARVPWPTAPHGDKPPPFPSPP
jgi:hypothetical protein